MILEDIEKLSAFDPEVGAAIRAEYDRQRGGLELIASENVVSDAVLLAAGVWLLNWKKMKVKSKKSEEIAYFRPYLSSYTEERDGQRETMEK